MIKIEVERLCLLDGRKVTVSQGQFELVENVMTVYQLEQLKEQLERAAEDIGQAIEELEG